jgi:hypothetical protein
VVKVPEGYKCPWYKSLTNYDDDGNECLGETDVAVGGVAVSAYQVGDGARDADPADPTVSGPDSSQSFRDVVELADFERAAKSVLKGRERDIFRAHYIKGQTLQTIAPKYGIGFQRVSKIARAARDKVLASEFAIHSANLRAVFPPWRETEAWIDRVERVDVQQLRRLEALLKAYGMRIHIPRPLLRRDLPAPTAARLALWRLTEFDREDITQGWWNQILVNSFDVPEKQERWRKRKSDVPGLWDQPTPLFHPPEEDAPVRTIHIAPWAPRKPKWVRPSVACIERHRTLSKQLLRARSRPSYYVAGYRQLWKKRLKRDDWRIEFQRRRHEEILSRQTDSSMNPERRNHVIQI